MNTDDTLEMHLEMQEKQIKQKAKIVKIEATDDCIFCGLGISSERQIATGGTNTCIDCKAQAEARAGSRH